MSNRGEQRARESAIAAVVHLMDRKVFQRGVLAKHYMKADFDLIDQWLKQHGVTYESSLQNALAALFEANARQFKDWRHDGSHDLPVSGAEATFVVGKYFLPDYTDPKASDVVKYFRYNDPDGLNGDDKRNIAACSLIMQLKYLATTITRDRESL